MFCITSVPGVVVVLWKYTSWHRVILGGANSCVALFLQLGQMQTIADPRGGNVRGLHTQCFQMYCPRSMLPAVSQVSDALANYLSVTICFHKIGEKAGNSFLV